MTFQLLISTMNQKDYSILDKMNVCFDAVVINQCGKEERKEFYREKSKILWINSKEKGLSKSRNMALKNASADICLLVDDDEELLCDTESKILEEFVKNPKADIIQFQVEGIEGKYKNYFKKSRKLNFLTSMQISSVELAFRRKKIIDNHISFDELLGAGAKYGSGEENLFICDCLKSKLKLFYVNTVISKLHLGNSCWFNGYNEKYFFGIGATYAGMSEKNYKLLIYQFALRHWRLYKEVSFNRAIYCMKQGALDYLKASKKRKGDVCDT